MNNLIIVILSLLTIILFSYIVFLKKQIHRIDELLQRRQRRNSDQMISVELLDSQINHLVEDINIALEHDQKMQMKLMHDEASFKELIADISHDLRTPLTAIQGYLQLLSKTELNQEQQNKLEVARKHVVELGELIAHFYEYSYLVDSKIEAKPEKINFTNLVMDCVAAVYPQLEEKEIKVQLGENQVEVYADREMTVRIIQNLLRNCITHAKDQMILSYENKKSPEGNPQVLFHVQNTVQDASVIDPKRIFDRFYVADQARKTTGLGLSIVKILAEQNKGSVTATLNNQMLDIVVTFVGC